MAGRIAVGVDVGGSGIKAAAVDVESGQLVSPRLRVATPQPSVPQAVVDTVVRLARRALDEPDVPDAAPVGVGIPAVVLDGVTQTATNIDPAWIGFEVQRALTTALGRPVAVLNDADAAGLAEMRFGAGRGRPGTTVVLTLGTGVGSALFIDGRLVPNTEFGVMEVRGRPAERRSAASARTRRGLSWKAWAADLDEHLDRIDQLVWPNLIIVGGGVSKRAEKFIPRLTSRVPVIPAVLENDAGIVGAAMAAVERAAATAGAPAPPPAAPRASAAAARGRADAGRKGAAASARRADAGGEDPAADSGP